MDHVDRLVNKSLIDEKSVLKFQLITNDAKFM